MGVEQNQPCQLAFSAFSRFDFQGSRVTSDVASVWDAGGIEH
jgi:hypothetical protein